MIFPLIYVVDVCTVPVLYCRKVFPVTSKGNCAHLPQHTSTKRDSHQHTQIVNDTQSCSYSSMACEWARTTERLQLLLTNDARTTCMALLVHWVALLGNWGARKWNMCFLYNLWQWPHEQWCVVSSSFSRPPRLSCRHGTLRLVRVGSLCLARLSAS